MKLALVRIARRARSLNKGVWGLMREVVRGFLEDQCLLRASALTYTSLLSLVPFLTIAFAVLKGLGVQKRIEFYLLERFTPASQEVIDKVMEYVDRTNASSLGVLGTVGLLVTAIMTLRTMEGAFNVVWRVPRSRPWLRSLADYASVLVIAPICGLAALSLTAYFNSPNILEKMESVWILGGIYRTGIRLSPLVILWVAFTLCYVLVPNSKIRVSSAALGAAVAALLWQLAQSAYVNYQFGVAKYNAIYGALSQLPVLFVWIFLSWAIVLLGAEVARCHQYRDLGGDLEEAMFFPQVLIMILERIHIRFRQGRAPFKVAELLGSTPIDRKYAIKGLQVLKELGWIASCGQDSDLVVFVKDPRDMELSRLARIDRPLRDKVWMRLQQGIEETLKGLTVADLGSPSDLKDILG